MKYAGARRGAARLIRRFALPRADDGYGLRYRKPNNILITGTRVRDSLHEA